MTKEVKNDIPCTMPDFRAEVERLQERVDKLTCENEYLKATLSNVTRNSEIMAAQLDIIHLIYGGNRNG